MSRGTVLFFISIVFLIVGILHIPTIPTFEEAFGRFGNEVVETKVLFVGDIMLGRYVETLMREQGSEYPFTGVSKLRQHYQTIIGNFEAPLGIKHVQTPSGGMSFSVDASIVPVLSRYIDVVSLANNHSLDQGVDAYHFSLDTLQAGGVQPFGTVPAASSSQIVYLAHDNWNIALIGLSAVGGFSEATAATVLHEAASQSDMQIVYIHWGEEYAPVHNEAQEKIAHQLVAFGADAIIGHHPHVIQDVALIDTVPVFYSVGNFIFDQYFSEEVQIGLGIELTLQNQEVAWRLIPFSALDSRSAPQVASYSQRQLILSEIAQKSSPELAKNIAEHGIVSGGYTLASF